MKAFASHRGGSLARGRYVWLYMAAVVVALLGLAALIDTSPRYLMYDEELHLRAAYLLAGVDDTAPENGRSLEPIGVREMLHTAWPSAPGPLYPVLHAALYPLTDFKVPQIRYVNLCLLVIAGFALAFALRGWGANHPWLLSSTMLAVPMTWDATGLAHTEIPALAMASCAVAAVAWATTTGSAKRASCYVGFIAAGVFTGTAILGRQTYLPAVVGFLAMAWNTRAWRGPALLGLVVSGSIPLPVFVAWGGVMNPAQRTIGGGVSISHGLVALAFLALVFAVLAPSFFLTRWRWSMAAVGVGVLLGLAGVRLEWRAFEGLLASVPALLGRSYSAVVGTGLLAVALGFIVSAGANLWVRRDDKRFVLTLGLTLMLAATAFGIVHQYTPRYAMSVFPFAVLAAQPFFTVSPWLLLRLAVGCALGASSLTYCYAHA